MACECNTTDSVSGMTGACKLLADVVSYCEEIEVEGEEGTEPMFAARRDLRRPEGEGGRPPASTSTTSPEALADAALGAVVRAPKRTLCRVVYLIQNGPTSTASITAFSSGVDSFTFAAPIAPGNAGTAVSLKHGRRDCETRKTGSVTGTCAAGGGMTLDEIEVCVLK